VTDGNRTAVIVTLVSGDEHVRRLLVSWPLVPAGVSPRRSLVAWSRLSGVPLAHTERLARVLVGHGLVLDDRTVDPEAQRIVAHFAAATLRRAGAKS
jgi:hypothetical protein